MLREQLHGLVDIGSFQSSIPYLVQSIAPDFSIFQESVDPDANLDITKRREKLNVEDQISRLIPANSDIRYRIEMIDSNFGESHD